MCIQRYKCMRSTYCLVLTALKSPPYAMRASRGICLPITLLPLVCILVPACSRGVQYSVLDRTGPVHFGPVLSPGLSVIRSSVWTAGPNWLVFFLGGHVGTVVTNDTIRPCQISAHPTSTGCLPMPSKTGGTSQPCHFSVFPEFDFLSRLTALAHSPYYNGGCRGQSLVCPNMTYTLSKDG